MQMLRDWQDPFILAIQEAIVHCEADSYLGTHEGEIFLVMSSHEEMEKVDAYLKKAYSFLDEDISVDFILPWNKGFDDEYCQCSGCGSIIQTSPDSYSWLPKYELCDAGIFCLECLSIESYLEDMLNDPKRANTIFSDDEIESQGFTKLNSEDYENGFHPWQNDSPPVILKKMQALHPTMDFFFSICASGQFEIHFDIWGRERDLEQD